MAATGAWLQDKIEDVMPDAIDRGIKPFIKPFMVQLADNHYELDISRAEQLLGWRPEHTLRRSLQSLRLTFGNMRFSFFISIIRYVFLYVFVII